MTFINREPPHDDADSDAPFRRSLEQLSEQLAARRPDPPTHIDATVRDPDDAPSRMGSAVKVVAVTLLTIAIVATIYSFRQGERLSPGPTVAEARPVTPPVEPKPGPPASTAMAVAPADPAPPAPEVAPSSPSIAPSAPAPTPLDRNGIREVQIRLRAIGIDPGPIDGTMGPLTERAVRRYVDRRGRGPVGIDSELLRQLQQEDGTNVAHRQ